MSSEEWAEQWIARYGPFWQAECNFCNEMSDCLDSPKELQGWISRHECSEKLTRLLPLSAREAGWKVVAK